MKRGSVGKSRGYARLFHFHDCLCYQQYGTRPCKAYSRKICAIHLFVELSNPLEVKIMYPLEKLIYVFIF